MKTSVTFCGPAALSSIDCRHTLKLLLLITHVMFWTLKKGYKNGFWTLVEFRFMMPPSMVAL